MAAKPVHPLLASLKLSDEGKLVSAREAVRLIRDGDTVATGGFVGIGFAEEIAIALEELFLSTEEQYFQAVGKPRNLTLVYAAGQGDGRTGGSTISPTKGWYGGSSAGTGRWHRSCRSWR